MPLASKHPAVSVVVAAKDAGATIAEACASVLRNPGCEVELLVVDDHSADGTAARLRHLEADPRVRLISAGGSGPYNARREGFEASRGDSVLFLDADDTLAPGALGCAAKALSAAEADICCLQVVERRPWSLRCRPLPSLTTDAMLEGAVHDPRRHNPAMIAKLYRRELLEPFPEIGYDGFWGEDRLFSMLLALRSPRLTAAPRARYIYRIGGASQNPLAPGRAHEYNRVYARMAQIISQHPALQWLEPLRSQALAKLLDYDRRCRTHTPLNLLKLIYRKML